MEHNISVAWLRLWSVVGATHLYFNTTATEQEIAADLARFELRRYQTACYALSSVRAAL